MGHDTLQKHAAARHLSAIATTGVHHRTGAWLYGDYREASADSAHNCAKECENDQECYHWNFHVVRHRCDLKGHHGEFNGDKGDWVTGNAKRYSPDKPPIVKTDL